MEPFGPWSPAIKSGKATWEQVSKMAPADLLKAMHESIDTDVAPKFGAARSEAKRWKLGLVVYEGGDGNTAGTIWGPYQGRDHAPLQRDRARPRNGRGLHPSPRRLEGLGRDPVNQFYDVGGYGLFGQWGALEYQDQDPATSPKYAALTGWIRTRGKESGR